MATRTPRIAVGYLHRDPRSRRIVVADDGHLDRGVGRRRDGHDPPQVHRHLEAKQVYKEIACLGRLLRLDVWHRSADSHVLGSTAEPRAPGLRKQKKRAGCPARGPHSSWMPTWAGVRPVGFALA